MRPWAAFVRRSRAGRCVVGRDAVPVLVGLVLVASSLVAAGPASAVSGPAAPESAQASRGDRVGPVRDVRYAPPVPGVLRRGFSAPATRWGPGHRGVDLAADPGDPIHAAGEGSVSFAGAVAGVRWVSVAHNDGVVTSYGPLASIAVEEGDTVRQGGVLGTLAPGHGPLHTGLHWSARRDGEYIDPLGLLGSWRPALVGPGDQEATDVPESIGYGDWRGRVGLRGRLGMVEGSRIAHGPGWELPPNPNHVIGVAGLSSDTTKTPMDLTHLGYDVEAITYLSYRGRDELGDVASDPRRDQLDYDREDTWRGVHAGAERLRDQLREQWARRPGEAVDLVGHSMGGLVVTYYLLTMHDPADPMLPPIGNVVALAAPLEGSDLATAGLTASRNPLALALIRGGGALVGQRQPDPLRDRVPHDLFLGSDPAVAVARGWRQAIDDVYAGPLATGTRLMTFGGSRDLIVPERRTSLPDGDHVVLPGGHSRMRRTEASRIAVRAFLAGEPVPGQAGGIGHYLSYPIGWAERVGGAVIGLQPKGVTPNRPVASTSGDR
jgi:murein DD-endopeptidase MepM/ murein hydrolase activator NlpD